jgi:site-specific DNA recombinase
VVKRQTGPPRYAIYLRCSSDDQAHSDYSTIDAQQELNEQYISEHGGVLIEVYKDEGRSGTNLKRPGWEVLLKAARQKRYDVVVCTYMSRLGRGDTYTVAEYLLGEHGVRVEFVKEKFTNDVAGFVNKQMTRFVDGMYVENVRQWTKTKMEQMAAKGYVCGGGQRFGYQIVPVENSEISSSHDNEPPKRLVPDPDEAPIVRQAFALFIHTRSLSQVRQYLNGVTTMRWNTDRVKYLLSNEVYLGILVHGEWRNEQAHEAIVERDLWQEVHDLLFSRKRIYPARNEKSYPFYLRGRLYCPHCDCIYTPYPAKSGTVLYYACMHGMKKVTACPVMRVNAEKLHDAILEKISHAASHHTVMHRLIAESGGWQTPDGELKERRGQIGKKKQMLQMEINNLTNAIAMGGNVRSLVSKLNVLETEVTQVEKEMCRLDREIHQTTVKRPTAEQVQEVWSNLIELWSELRENEREELLGTIVQRVEVKEKNLVLLELASIAEVRGSKFEINQKWEGKFL